MVVWKYEDLDGNKKKTLFNKNATTYFLSIGCPLIALIFLCCFNVWYFRNEYSSLDNGFLLQWEQEFGTFINDYYFKNKGFPFFIWTEENVYNKIEVPNLPNPPKPSPKVCSSVPNLEKFDCFPRGIANENLCTKRGCCYNAAVPPKVPFCFYPPGFNSYSYKIINRTDRIVEAELNANYNPPYPNVVSKLVLRANFVTDNILTILVDVKNSGTFSAALNIENKLKQTTSAKNVLYDFIIDPASSGFQVVRKSTNTSIFNSRDIGGFTFTNQFIQISSKLPCKQIYGLGEGRTDLPLNTNWTTRTLWNHDTPPTDGINGYGFFPLYMCLEGKGLAHIAVFQNLLASDFVLQPGAITYRTLGAPLMFTFFLGNTPLEAVKQTSVYLNLRSIIPPYWSLGFHLCRFGYKSVDDMKSLWNKTRAAGIPYDTQWVDIDYMKNRNDFTVDPKFKDLGNFVKTLHKEGMHFVPILDPGVSGSEPKGTYPPYDLAVKLGILVMDSKGKKPLVGKVWNPTSTVFPDFTHRKIIPYWREILKNFYNIVPFDGLWLDMNEPSNFVNGSLVGCPSNSLEDPPYVPAIQGGVLNYRTLCMSAKHSLGPHYSIHNGYGFFETGVTSFALAQIRSKRPFVISRSSTVLSGNFGGHWTGDIYSTWEDMAQSVKDIIHMSMYGINLVGADICGFNSNTTVNLCRRWHQLGAFYPFSRNHNSDDARDQDPVSLGIVASTKKALLLRYSLLPYLYTLFWLAKSSGAPVIRPMFYLFPEDEASYTVNTQFMWGDGLLISPVLEEGITYVKTYLGKCIWYDIYTSEKIFGNSSQPYVLAAPEDTIPVLIRGGTILVMQEPNVTTTLSRKNPFFLKVALNENNEAAGLLYWDDGESIDGKFSTIYFNVKNNTLMSKNDEGDFKINLSIHKIEIFSLDPVKNVTINQKLSSFNFNSTSKVLTLSGLQLPIQQDFNVTWS